MEYDDASRKYVARESRTGAVAGSFTRLKEYDDFVKGLGCVSKYPPGTTLVETGFLEFAARDPATQARYDAMSSTWEGPKAAESAITQGAYNLDFDKNAATRYAKKQSTK
jgi:hypothetical protein